MVTASKEQLPPNCYTSKAAYAAMHVNLEQATQTERAQWEPFQIDLLNNSSPFEIINKSRQIGCSWAFALDAVCDGVANPGTPHLFVSINLEEALEKIRYARLIVESIWPESKRPVLVRDAAFGLEFANGSRLISHPCRPPRGKARARIYLDEMAHYQQNLTQPIYRGALPATVRGDGYVRIGSSPLGASGLFWEIFSQTLRKWPGYDGRRSFVPWWHSSALCCDVETAIKVAPHMTTEERVRAFGTPAIIVQFENNFLEDFQQEFECAWVDESVAWISWEMLAAIQRNDLVCWHSKSVDEALVHLQEVSQAIRRGQIEGVLCGGIDVGRVRDLTEFIVIGKGPGRALPLRWMISLEKCEFRHQQALFLHLLNSLPFTLVLVDQNGIGMHLAETLERTGRAVGVDFTAPTKELLAVEARIQTEARTVAIPAIRDLIYQIHSIRKVPGVVVNHFDVEASAKHHADKFWAWALGVFAANAALRLGQETSMVIDELPNLGLDW